jgi:hypothetical protein
MVKLSLRGAQDPSDSSLQMKVYTSIILDSAIPCIGSQITH